MHLSKLVKKFFRKAASKLFVLHGKGTGKYLCYNEKNVDKNFISMGALFLFCVSLFQIPDKSLARNVLILLKRQSKNKIWGTLKFA